MSGGRDPLVHKERGNAAYKQGQFLVCSPLSLARVTGADHAPAGRGALHQGDSVPGASA